MIFIRYALTVEEYEKAEIFIKRIKPLLRTGDFVVERTEKNKDFDEKFSLSNQEKCNILSALTAKDCYQIESNNNPRYKEAEIYKFFKEIEMFVYGELEILKLYLKMYIRETKTYDVVIVISFHEEGMYDV